jgi:hypothetical protein
VLKDDRWFDCQAVAFDCEKVAATATSEMRPPPSKGIRSQPYHTSHPAEKAVSVTCISRCYVTSTSPCEVSAEATDHFGFLLSYSVSHVRCEPR